MDEKVITMYYVQVYPAQVNVAAGRLSLALVSLYVCITLILGRSSQK